MKLAQNWGNIDFGIPAAFGRLCVETITIIVNKLNEQPAAFGRLCVETYRAIDGVLRSVTSRLRAAVC